MLQSHKHGLLLPLSAMWISISQILIAMVLEGTTGTLDLVGAVEVLAAAAVAVEEGGCGGVEVVEVGAAVVWAWDRE